MITSVLCFVIVMLAIVIVFAVRCLSTLDDVRSQLGRELQENRFLREEIESLEERLADKEQSLREHRATIARWKIENEKLSGRLRSEIDESDSLKSRLALLEQDHPRLLESLRKHSEQNAKYSNLFHGIRHLLEKFDVDQKSSRQRPQQEHWNRKDTGAVVPAVTSTSDGQDVCERTPDPVSERGPEGSGDERVHERSSACCGAAPAAGVPEGSPTLQTECDCHHEDRGGSDVAGPQIEGDRRADEWVTQDIEQCVGCGAPTERGTAGCRDCNEYAAWVCRPEPERAQSTDGFTPLKGPE